MKLGGNVLYTCLSKCCYFVCQFEIKYGGNGSHFEKSVTNLNSRCIGGISIKLVEMSFTHRSPRVAFLSRFKIQYGHHGSHFEKPITNLNSNSTGGISMKLGLNVLYTFLSKYCYFFSLFEIQYGHQGSYLENLIQT